MLGFEPVTRGPQLGVLPFNYTPLHDLGCNVLVASVVGWVVTILDEVNLVECMGDCDRA